MKKKYWISGLISFSLLMLFLIASCNRRSNDKSFNLSFQDVSIYQESAKCQDNPKRCATVEINLPHAFSEDLALSNKVNQQISGSVIKVLNAYGDAGMPLSNMKEVAENFIAEYTEYSSYSEFLTMPWELKVNGSILHQGEKTISIQLDNWVYSGGAHPNTMSVILNIDSQTGDLILLTDIIKDIPSFKSFAEQMYWNAKDGKNPKNQPAIQLTSKSLFMLPDNYAILEDGILLHYNPHEMSTFADGSFSFLLTFEQLKDILKNDIVF
ncbi:MAG: DUF4163 domain-containing protein [Bacteroidota bacterium]